MYSWLDNAGPGPEKYDANVKSKRKATRETAVVESLETASILREVSLCKVVSVTTIGKDGRPVIMETVTSPHSHLTHDEEQEGGHPQLRSVSQQPALPLPPDADYESAEDTPSSATISIPDSGQFPDDEDTDEDKGIDLEKKNDAADNDDPLGLFNDAAVEQEVTNACEAASADVENALTAAAETRSRSRGRDPQSRTSTSTKKAEEEGRRTRPAASSPGPQLAQQYKDRRTRRRTPTRQRPPQRTNPMTPIRAPRCTLTENAVCGRQVRLTARSRSRSEIREGRRTPARVSTNESDGMRPAKYRNQRAMELLRERHAKRPWRDGEAIPASLTGNFMIATWAVSELCDLAKLCVALTGSTFLCIVLSLTSEVVAHHPLHKLLESLSHGHPLFSQHDGQYSRHLKTCIDLLLKARSFHKISENIFVGIEKAKVESCQITRYQFDDNPQSRTTHCTLSIALNTTRQSLDSISVGIADVREMMGAPTLGDATQLAKWIKRDTIAILTGWFGAMGDNACQAQGFLRDIAVLAKAIWERPVFQGVNDSRLGRVASPMMFLFFGFFSHIRFPDPFAFVPDKGRSTWKCGEDLADEMVPFSSLIRWRSNDTGSAFVPHLHNIKMPAMDWNKALNDVVQTPIFVGQATPSFQSQLNAMANSSYGSNSASSQRGRTNLAGPVAYRYWDRAQLSAVAARRPQGDL